MTRFLCFILGGVVIAQNQGFICGTTYMTEKLLRENPELKKTADSLRDVLEKFTLQFAEEQKNKKQAQQVKIIPVVVHIIHNFGPENISDAQVRSAIDLLNRDFRKRSPDTVDIVPQFKSIAADVEVEFRLAQKDPNGNCTNGIVRVVSPLTYNADDGVKALSMWPRDKYLNIWVVASIAGGAAGYAYLPPTATPTNDGVVIRHDYFGEIGTSDLVHGRALVHEVGHWLNLLHTWGPTNTPGDPSNCNSDDGVADTPNTIGHTTCNLNSGTCGSPIDNVQNFMEYSYCFRMFTQGQKTRMQAALNSTVAGRYYLWQQSNLIATGVSLDPILCRADFSAQSTFLCAKDSVQFQDMSFNGVTQWLWSFPGGVPNTSTAQNPVVLYPNPGNFNVSLTVGNGTSTIDTSKNNYIHVLPRYGIPPQYTQSFENTTPNSDFFVYDYDGNGYTWQIKNGVGASGTHSLMVEGYYTSSGYDEFVSPSIDLRAYSSATLSFKYAIAPKGTDYTDALKLYISKDCGKTWLLRWQSSGSSLYTTTSPVSSYFVPSPSHWKQVNVFIPVSYLTGGFAYKFSFLPGDGNNLYIDDINISGTYSMVPALRYPDNGDTVTSPVKIDWLAVPTADTYYFEVDTSPLFSSPYLISGAKKVLYTSSDSSDSEFILTGLNHNTVYYWRVRVSAGGNTYPWSQVWHFTVDTIIDFNVPEHHYEEPLFTIFRNGNLIILRYDGNTTIQGKIMLFAPDGKTLISSPYLNFMPGDEYNLGVPPHSFYIVLVCTEKNLYAVKIL